MILEQLDNEESKDTRQLNKEASAFNTNLTTQPGCSYMVPSMYVSLSVNLSRSSSLPRYLFNCSIGPWFKTFAMRIFACVCVLAKDIRIAMHIPQRTCVGMYLLKSWALGSGSLGLRVTICVYIHIYNYMRHE